MTTKTKSQHLPSQPTTDRVWQTVILALLVCLSLFTSGCADKSAGKTAKIAFSINPHHKALGSPSGDRTIPAEITSLTVKLYQGGTQLDATDLIAQAGNATFYAPINTPLHLRSDAYNGAEHLFTGQADITPLSEGETRPVTLALNSIIQIELAELRNPNPSPVSASTTRQFKIKATGLQNTAVDWFVNGVKGGNEALSTIDSEGTYVAPARASIQTVVVRAVPVVAPSFAREFPVELDIFTNQAPTITLNGDAHLVIAQNSVFTEPGATALDAEEGDISYAIQISGAVQTGVVGSYSLTYRVTDSNSVTTEVVRTIRVVQAPTLQATAGNGQITLTWNAVADATEYRIYRSSTPGVLATGALHATVAGSSYADTGRTDGSTYYYRVTAMNATGSGPASNEAGAPLRRLIVWDEFTDANLRDCVQQARHSVDAVVYVHEVKYLNCYDETSLAGIEQLTELTTLDIFAHGGGAIDLAPLRGLTALTSLYVRDAEIHDLSPLSGLPALASLYLDQNKLTDISALRSLKALTRLNLSENLISDLSPLRELTALTSLDLDSNNITDISPLQGLIALTYLRIPRNQISDISALRSMTAMAQLDLYSNTISDVSALSGMSALAYLDLNINKIVDISTLARMTELTRLYLGSNRIADISAMSRMTKMTDLYLSENQIVDILPLRDMAALRTLRIDSNNVIDISPLSHLAALEHASLSLNKITRIPTLSGLTTLSWLYLSSNQITDISGLSGLSALSDLYLDSNSISTIPALTGLPALWSIELRSNQIVDPTPLSTLTAVRNVSLEDNPTLSCNNVTTLNAQFDGAETEPSRDGVVTWSTCN